MTGDREYLEFIAESIDLVQSYTESGYDHYMSDVGNQDQVIRRMEILADATAHLSDDLQDRHTEIEWKAIQGFRNRVAHGYMDVNQDLVWQAVQELPELERVVERELARTRDSNRSRSRDDDDGRSR